MKKIISIVVVVLLLVLAFPLVAFAAPSGLGNNESRSDKGFCTNNQSCVINSICDSVVDGRTVSSEETLSKNVTSEDAKNNQTTESVAAHGKNYLDENNDGICDNCSNPKECCAQCNGKGVSQGHSKGAGQQGGCNKGSASCAGRFAELSFSQNSTYSN